MPYLYCLILGLSLSGCVSEDTVTSSNQPPIAVIDTNDRAVTGELVFLNGRQSSDVDSLSYQWQLFSAPILSHSTLSQSDSSSFVPDVDGDYTISLIVNDGQVASPVSKITVRSVTANTSPTADAGVDQSILTGQTVQLSGVASHDIDEDTLSTDGH